MKKILNEKMLFLIGVTIASVLVLFVMKFDRNKAQQREYTINVSGACEKRLENNRHKVFLRFEDLKKDEVAMKKDLQDKYNELYAKIKDFKSDKTEFETSNFNVNKETRRIHVKTGGKQGYQEETYGYKGQFAIQVVSEDKKVIGKIIKAAEGFKNLQISNISSFVDTKTYMKAKDECTVQAVANAKEKALGIVKAADSKLGRMVSFSQNKYMPYGNAMAKSFATNSLMEMKATVEYDDAIEIEAGKQDVNVNVSVSFEIN